jgi:hypothetical protein
MRWMKTCMDRRDVHIVVVVKPETKRPLWKIQAWMGKKY